MSDNLSDEIKNLAERFKSAPGSRLFAPLADAYRKSGLVDKAIEFLEQGLEKYPDYASAHVILGKCFYDKGATERSRTEFKKVIDLDPENMVALKYMGDILLAEDNRDEALQYYRKLLAIDPTNEEVNLILEDTAEEFQTKEIDLRDKNSVKKLEQIDEPVTMTLAGIYASQGYHARALKMYQEILAADPENTKAREMITNLQENIKVSTKQRDEVFDDQVMTITLDDVTEELAQSTSGPGGEDEEGALEEIADEELEEGRTVAIEEDTAEPDLVARELEKEDGKSDKPEKKKEVKEPGKEFQPDKNLDSFQTWLRKMKDKAETEE
ncbi:MAG: tetratricopeptide repeat protein [Candidatus Krumholzibacteriota bacterium]|nr:tetratricopeptide repeat protein [Candidatus Krumholzibacteriota bacterium]